MSIAFPPYAVDTGCPVCGGQDCTSVPDVDHLASYPFLPGGRDPMAGQEFMIAPHRVDDPETGVPLYGAQDKVPIDEAIRLGLVERPKAAPAKKAARKATKRAKKGPAEDRARRPREDR